MAALAAALIGSGTSKCGWPMLRLIGSLSDLPSSNTLRMPDISMARVRSASQDSGITMDSSKRTEYAEPQMTQRTQTEDRMQT